MRKIKVLVVFLGVVLVLSASNAFARGAVKFGIDFGGTHEASGPGGTADADSVQTGFTIAGELFASVNKNVDLGGGILFQLPREIEFGGTGAGEFTFMPIYALIRVKSVSDKIAPYGIGQLGWNLLFDGDSDYKGPFSLSGGLYYGIGAGVLIKKRFAVEALYSVNKGEADYLGASADVTNTQFTLNFGINF